MKAMTDEHATKIAFTLLGYGPILLPEFGRKPGLTEMELHSLKGEFGWKVDFTLIQDEGDNVRQEVKYSFYVSFYDSTLGRNPEIISVFKGQGQGAYLVERLCNLLRVTKWLVEWGYWSEYQ